MPSLIPGYEYDIFISYRQKDNKGDKWVTQFVEALRTELEATFKEDVSIYFDENPHDGLLETHDVDKSLEGRLKCAIFMPILSQTYCDPRSFAWQKEFCAFNRMASHSAIGKDIQLKNGNVASRILPVKIHELQEEDEKLFESETGSRLRAIEFIYKEAGVNRPIRPTEETPANNQNHTIYRNQINKVANSIREILTAMGHQGSLKDQGIEVQPRAKRKRTEPWKLWIPVIAVLIAVGAWWFKLDRGKEAIIESKGKSIAVLPFKNLTGDKEQDYISDGITDQIISRLSRLRDVKIIAYTSVMKYKGSNKGIRDIANELGVTHVLEGTLMMDKQIRFNTKLISAADESLVWSKEFRKLDAEILDVIDEVSGMVANSLAREALAFVPGEHPKNRDAYEHFLKGLNISLNYYTPTRDEAYFVEADRELREAIRLDPEYAVAYCALADLNDTGRDEKEGRSDLATQFARKAYELAPDASWSQLTMFESMKDLLEMKGDGETTAIYLDSAYRFIRRAAELAPNDPLICNEFGFFLGVYLGLLNQGIDVSAYSSGLDPYGASYLTSQARLYFYKGEYEMAIAKCKIAMELDDKNVLSRVILMRISYLLGDIDAAKMYYRQMESINPNYFAVRQLKTLFLQKNTARKLMMTKPYKFYLFSIPEQTESALDTLELYSRSGFTYGYLRLISNELQLLHKEPRYKKILERSKRIYESNLARYGDISWLVH